MRWVVIEISAHKSESIGEMEERAGISCCKMAEQLLRPAVEAATLQIWCDVSGESAESTVESEM